MHDPKLGRWKVGLLGAGYISDWHIRALRPISNVEVVAVCDLNRSRAESFATRHGLPGVFTSIEEMARTAQCDMIHVLLPPDLHYSGGKQALEAGVSVLLEKPACVTPAECQELAALAASRNLKIGVSHNFLYSPIYEQLREDVRAGLLGPISEVSIVWNKELGQIKSGPFGGWLFREPANVMLEVGPHSVAHLMDLVGVPESMDVQTDRHTTIANGKPFARRWRVNCTRGPVATTLDYSLGGGFTEHRIHVRGWIGSATCDFEAGTYVLRRNSPLPDDFDRYKITRHEAKSLLKQSRNKLFRYLFAKMKLTKHGNDFGVSIAHSLSAFYRGLSGSPPAQDPRSSMSFATSVVEICGKIGEVANRTLTSPSTPDVATPPKADPRELPGSTVLVLGGTGFIGQAVVRHLVSAGHPVRLLVRDPRNLPLSLLGAAEVVRGDLTRPEDLDQAMAGVSSVIHLARAHVKTWEDYVQQEIGGTRNVALACLRTGIQRLLYTGTIDSCYSGQPGVIKDENALDPKVHRRNLYARAKAESEKLLTEMYHKQNLPLVLFRPGIVIGSGGSPFHWGVGMWSGSGVCRIWGNGKNLLPFVLVEDVARALTTAVTTPDILGKSFNLVGPQLISGQEYLAELEKAAGMKLDLRPTSILRFYSNDLFKWVIKILVRHPERRFPSLHDWRSRRQMVTYDCTNAQQLLKWKPENDRMALIQEGIVKPVQEWLK